MLCAYVGRPPNARNGSIISPQSVKQLIHPAHLVQNQTKYTLCGRVFTEKVEIDSRDSVKLCKTCTRRAKTLLKTPQGRQILGLEPVLTPFLPYMAPLDTD